jgi:hypothetical protein
MHWIRRGALLFSTLLALETVASAATTGPDVLTQRNDLSRTGQNNAETALTLASVRPATFGKLLTLPVDGLVLAQPLTKRQVTIGGALHDVVFVATEHDSLYAFDVASGAQLWKTSYITPPSVTTEPYADTGDDPPTAGQEPLDVYPEVGISSTPVIDPSTSTLYVVAKTKESGTYRFRLHAVDITTGLDRVPNVIIQPTVAGTAADGTGTQVTLVASAHQQRPGLLLLGGNVYVAFGSSADNFSWHGWMVAYHANNLSFAAAWNSSPNASEAGIWSSGEGPAVDSAGNIYVPTGNGSFDGATSFGDSIVRLSTASGLTEADFYAPFNQSLLSTGDDDIGSGGVVLLPDVAGTTAHPHLVAASGKAGTIYLLDRDHLGGFNPSTTNPDAQIVQYMFSALGTTTFDNFGEPFYAPDSYSTPAFWRDAAGRNHLYWGGVGDNIKMFDLTNGLLSTTPVSTSAATFGFPGVSPSISSNGTGNGILWAVQHSFANGDTVHAYDATNLATELWNSDQAANGRDKLGAGAKFAVVTVTAGRVFVPTQSSVVVYGLLGPPPAVPALPPAGVWVCAIVLAAGGLRALSARRARR